MELVELSEDYQDALLLLGEKTLEARRMRSQMARMDEEINRLRQKLNDNGISDEQEEGGHGGNNH